MNVKISSGNSKMGSIRSVSLPAGVTCRNDCECKTKCYAKKLERIRKNVREAYRSNYQLLKCARTYIGEKSRQPSWCLDFFAFMFQVTS